MPQARTNAGSTDVSSVAQERFTMSMTKEVGGLLDKVAQHMSDAVQMTHGLTVAFERTKVVESLVRAELRRIEGRDAATNADTPAAA